MRERAGALGGRARGRPAAGRRLPCAGAPSPGWRRRDQGPARRRSGAGPSGLQSAARRAVRHRGRRRGRRRRAAVRMAEELAPDVVLMDIRMPGMDGLEATRRIVQNEELDRTRIVILTTFDVDEYVFEALRIGASGFLVKDTEPEVLLQGVRAVARGDALLSPGVTRRRASGRSPEEQAPAFPSGSDGRSDPRHRDVQRHRRRPPNAPPRSGTGAGETSSTATTSWFASELGDHGGREIKTTGDGFLALFDAPARAIRCAIAIRERLASRGRRRPDRAALRRGRAARERRRRDRRQHRRSSGGVRLGRRRGGVEHGEGPRGRIGHRVRRLGSSMPSRASRTGGGCSRSPSSVRDEDRMIRSARRRR